MMRETEDIMDTVRRLDPIDADRLAGYWSRSTDKQTMLETIMAAPETPAPQRRRQVGLRRRPTFALAGLVVLIAAAVALAPSLVSDRDAAYAVRPLPDGGLVVEMLPSLRDGSALQVELREYGVDAEVVTIVASPSLVGQVSVQAEADETGLPPGLSVGGEDGTPEVFQLTIHPDVFQGQLTIEVAVAAEDGEPYQLRASVFSPGEVLGGLHCALGEPVSAADVAVWLDRLGLQAEWSVLSPTTDPSITDSTIVASVPAGDVVAGYAADATTIAFDVAPPGADLPIERAEPLSDVDCTAELAAAWTR